MARGVPPVPITDNGAGVFTRATAATYYETVSAHRILKSAAINVARINTEPGTGVPKVLLEPAATNLIGYSERADQWTLTGGTVTSNALVAPDLNNTGDVLTVDTSNGLHCLDTPTATIPAGAAFSAMVFVQRPVGTGAQRVFRVEVRSLNGTAAKVAQSFPHRASFPAAPTETTGGATVGTFAKHDVGETASVWSRITIPNIVMPNDVTQVCIRVYAQNFTNINDYNQPGGLSYVGDGAATMAVWGADLKVGATYSSYFPTPTSATATRAADIYGNMMVSNVPEPEAVWSSATTYTKGQRVRGNTTDTQHVLFESLQGSNLNKPLTDTDWWFRVGPTNRWAPFDTLRSTGATAASPMYYAITPFAEVDTAAFSNVVADRYTLEVISAGVTVYSVSGELGDDPRSRAAFDLPNVPDPTITLTLERDAGDVTLGSFDVGLSIYLGEALEGAERGALNFSRVERDPFGNLITVLRRSVPTLTATTIAMIDDLPSIDRAHVLSNANVWLWFGIERPDHPYFAATFIRGICREFRYRMAATTIQVDLMVEEV